MIWQVLSRFLAQLFVLFCFGANHSLVMYELGKLWVCISHSLPTNKDLKAEFEADLHKPKLDCSHVTANYGLAQK